MSDYFKSARGQILNQARALQELRRHGVPESEFPAFFKECGDCPTYTAQYVLRYLGY